eukprot:INCI17673.7.p1 GENE.INCI17673.7~~INCI17673.7.p1  ORF type:complete len:329 (+),score=65.00 INCI17673.7:423-1409(+)
MQNRKRGYQHVATAVTDGAREDSDEEASLARDDKPARASLSRVSSTAAESGSDFEDDEESGLEDDERLNKQLDLEMAELEKLSAALDSSRRHSPYCLARCFCGTRNSRTISVWFFTFLIFGVVEIVGSIKANSLSMMGDAVLMILDAVTYGANIYADYECAKEHRKDDLLFRDRTHFAAALFSLVVISAVEVYVITDAVLRILAPLDEDEPVNASIMFILTGINAFLDVVGAVMLCWEHKCCCNWKRLRTDVNMFSAALHLISDCFRTVAVIIAASLIQFDTSINGDVADAGASLVCSSVVLHVVQRGGPSSSDVLMWRVAECKCSWS